MANKNNEVIGLEELSVYDALIKHYINDKSNITVDDAISDTSMNPVQNRVITNTLNNKQDKLTVGSGINIDSNNTISADISGYQKFIDSNTTPHTEWSAGTTGELKYEVQSDGSRHLYRYEGDAWTRVFEITVHTEGTHAINVPLTDIVITSVDIGEGVSLNAGTIVLVVE